jgi:NAD(P) transhydrogenase subunit alpha
MKPGSVIVDLAAEQGGNVEGTEPGRVATVNGVKLIGPVNLAATVAADASALYARNVLNFVSLSLNTKTGEFAIPRDDEIVKATLVCDAGAVVPRG